MESYKESGFPQAMAEDSLRLTYLLLYGRYANTPIANRDLNQWEIKLYSLIFQYGPTWEKQLNIQQRLREMTEEEIETSGKAIYNNASNPDTGPSTTYTKELPFINSQSTSRVSRSKVDSYGILWELLDSNVTETYIQRFQPLFKMFVRQEFPTLYREEVEDNEEY